MDANLTVASGAPPDNFASLRLSVWPCDYPLSPRIFKAC